MLAAGERRQPARYEILLAGVLFALLLWLKLQSVYHYRFDSDEPQHLHIVWGWANGYVQYKDVFDNHSPLFHMLCAPLFWCLGERADVLFPMRLAMVPLYAFSIWCVFRIASVLYSPRIGLWTAVFTAAFPKYFFESTEFRTDDLWAALWFLCLLILVSGKLTVKRAFAFGVAIGAAFGVSMKTSLLLATLLGGALVALLFRGFGAREKIAWGHLVRCGAWFLAGVVIIPGILLGVFAFLHALPEMYYCVIKHSIVPNSTRINALRTVGFWLKIALPFLVGASLLVFRCSPDRTVGSRRVMMILATVFFATILFGYWPDVTREDYLPLCPMVALIFVPLLFLGEWTRWPWKSGHAVTQALIILLAVGEVAVLRTSFRFGTEHTGKFIAQIADVLRLTTKDDYVMDATGDSIYRKRPYYYALETFTNLRMRLGILPEDIIPKIIEKRTAVAWSNGCFDGSETRAWIAKNYLPIGDKTNHVCVAGKMLPPSADAPNRFEFDVEVPLRYVLVSDQSTEVTGTLDGIPYAGPVVLEPKHHVFQAQKTPGPLALFWAGALEKGYSPFHPRR